MKYNQKRSFVKSKEPVEHTIPMKNFSKLVEIFKFKSWEIENDSNDVSTFNRFCSTLSGLTDEEQMLTLELTERFIRILPEEYTSYLKKVLVSLVSDTEADITKFKNIYIAPLISPLDFGKPKSSIVVQYYIRSLMSNISELASKNIVLTEGLNVVSGQINNDKSILLLVDDFVGTGGTACEAIKYLMDDKSIDKEKIVVLSIAALQIGVTRLEDLKVPIYTELISNKGITDFYPSDIVQEKIVIMESIEEKIKAHDNEKLGYMGSEALITLARTPNNTFPVFWKQKNNKKAPFPR